MATPPISLLDHNILLLPIHEQQKERAARKKDAVHDPERKRRLQHCALLVDVESKGVVPVKPVRAQGDVESAVVGEMRAVGVGDAA